MTPILTDSSFHSGGISVQLVSAVKAVKRNKKKRWKKRWKNSQYLGDLVRTVGLRPTFSAALCCVLLSSYTDGKSRLGGSLTGPHCTPSGFAPLPSASLHMDCGCCMVPFPLSRTFRREDPCSSVFLLRDDFCCFWKSVKRVKILVVAS